jgi:Arc/MetJ family transcription regulator
LDIHTKVSMRTNIDIDDALLAEAMDAAGTTTKKATVEAALRELVQNHRGRQAIANLRGLGWEGNLDEMRQGRDFDHIK